MILRTSEFVETIDAAQFGEDLPATPIDVNRFDLQNAFVDLNLYDADGWRKHLDRAGYDVDEVRTIASRPTSWAFDLMLYPSLVGYFIRRLTGRWVAMPSLRPLTVDAARAIVNSIGRLAPEGDAAAEFLILARKR